MKKRNIALVALFVALGAGNAQAIPGYYYVTSLAPTAEFNTAISSANGNDGSTIEFQVGNPPLVELAGNFTHVTSNVTFNTAAGPLLLVNDYLSTSAGNNSVLTIDNSSTLYLPNDISINGSGDSATSGTIPSINAIRSTGDLNIVAYETGGLAGNYSVATNSNNTNYGNAYTIYGFNNVTITGDVSGNVTAQANKNNAVGIYAYGLGKGTGYLTLNGDLSGNITATAGNSSAYGLRADRNISINGTLSGDITATATNGSYAYGMSADEGNMYITGGIGTYSDITATANNSYAYGLFADNYLNITGNLNGDVSATATNGNRAYGLFAEDDDLNITGDIGRHSVINATANNSYAYGLSAGNNLSINGSVNGDVSASATNGNYAYGLNAGDTLTIGGDIGMRSDISAYAGQSYARGLYAVNDITINGSVNGDISARANTGSNAAGLFAADNYYYNNIHIAGDIGWRSDITAYAGQNDAYGIYAGDSITIDGHIYGDINATANKGILAAGLYALDGNVTVTQGIGSHSEITATAGNSFAYGIRSFSGNIIIGGELAGDITATAGDALTGTAAAGLAAYGQISGLSNAPLLITGNISATSGNGTAAGIMAYGPMNLDIHGTVSGQDLNDLTGTGYGYAIISGGFNMSSGAFQASQNVEDMITVEENGKLVGNVDLGQGNDTMLVKDSADITNVPLLSGGTGSESARSDSGVTIPSNMASGDLLEFNNFNGTLGPQVKEWENIWVTNGSYVDLGDGIANSLNISTSSIYTLQFNIDAGSEVYGGGHSPMAVTIAGDLLLNGSYSMLDNEVNDSLTVTGNYSGTGSLYLDADLSTSNVTSAEQLIIEGDATDGPTTVYVNNVVNPVAVTSGNGIEIINVGGNTDSGMFTLGNPNDFGPFAVDLVQGTSDENWYLVSPGYREEAAVLQAVTPFVEKLGYESIPRFHERRTYTWFADQNAEKSAFWVRGYGSKYRLGMSGDAATELDGYSGGMQIGADIAAGGKDTRHNIGLYAGIGYNEADVAGLRSDLAGKLNDTAYSVGAYVTVHNPDKFYIEGVAQATSHNLDIDYLTYPKHEVDMWSYLGSLEVGVGIPIGKCFTLQPQAQLVYQHTDGLGITTPMLTGDVNIEEHDALQGRLGITGMFKSCEFDFNPFFEINLIKDFSESNRVTYSMNEAYYADSKEPVTLSSKPETLFLGGAIGISRRVSEKNNLSYFLKAEAIYGLDDLDSYNYRLNVGIRKTF